MAKKLITPAELNEGLMRHVKARMAFTDVKAGKLAEEMGCSGGYLSECLAGAKFMNLNLFFKICIRLDLSPTVNAPQS